MTMYLPNPDLSPTGCEPGEFIEVHRAGQPGDRPAASLDRRGRATTVGLDTQTRMDITHSAAEYISGLVEWHNGDGDDVRAVIRDLHHQIDLRDAGKETST
jgi:hypothetical protein